MFSLCCHTLTCSLRTVTGAVSFKTSPNTRVRPLRMLMTAPIRAGSCSAEISTINPSLLGILVLVDWNKSDHLHSRHETVTTTQSTTDIKTSEAPGVRGRMNGCPSDHFDVFLLSAAQTACIQCACRSQNNSIHGRVIRSSWLLTWCSQREITDCCWAEFPRCWMSRRLGPS